MHGTLKVRPSWFPDWSGQVCALIASGPSVKAGDVDLLKGRCRVAVVNNGYEIAPWADLLYAADARWWRAYPTARNFAGLKVTTDAGVAKSCKLHSIELLGEIDDDGDRISIEQPGRIARGGNGAFQLVNLVTQFGASRQIWIGFDFTGEHWHGNHPEPLKNPRAHTLEKWRRRLDANAPTLASLGVDVVNVSEMSTLTDYPKMALADVLAKWL